MNRYDLVSPVARKDGQTFWRNVGTAFPEKNGPGFVLIFDALPLPGPDGCRVLMRPPLAPREDAAPRVSSGTRKPASDTLDDEIPF